MKPDVARPARPRSVIHGVSPRVAGGALSHNSPSDTPLASLFLLRTVPWPFENRTSHGNAGEMPELSVSTPTNEYEKFNVSHVERKQKPGDVRSVSPRSSRYIETVAVLSRNKQELCDTRFTFTELCDTRFRNFTNFSKDLSLHVFLF